jgi:hypothetical protein
MDYRLLIEFERLFAGRIYKHRVSTHGDWVAIHLYEDLFILGRSQHLNERVGAGTRVIAVFNRVQGLRSRRGDGTFGEIVPLEESIREPGYAVGRARVATIEIGVEVKILAKAMIKQIDRVCSDLRNQQIGFRRVGANCITVGIVGVNHAKEYVGYEGSRQFPTTGRDGFLHPIQEARAAIGRLLSEAAPAFDHFLILPFSAANRPPFEFRWVNASRVARDYGAMLVRIGVDYDRRFGNPPHVQAE